MSTDQSPPDMAKFNTAITSGAMVIAKFETKACVICRRINPILSALAGRMKDKLHIVEVDAQDDGALAERYHIMSVPTLILFKDGDEVSRCSGFQSSGMLNEWVAPHLDG